MRRLLVGLFALLITTEAFAQTIQTKALTTTVCPGAGCLTVPVAGAGSVGVQITGTFVGTLQFEESIDGVIYDVWAMFPNNVTASVTSATATGLWVGGTNGVSLVRVRFSAYTSGTATVNIVGSADGSATLAGLFGERNLASYAVHVSNIAVTALDDVLNLESEAARGFRISQMCITPGQATAAAWVQWQLIRTTTASTAGTVISPESTTTHSISKSDVADVNWSGLARFAATEGTSGAVLDAGTLFVNVAATPPAVPGQTFCREYGMNGSKLPTVAAGVTNGVKLIFTGTAGGTGFSAMLRFIAK